jgi:hypothetical protein
MVMTGIGTITAGGTAVVVVEIVTIVTIPTVLVYLQE